VRLILDVVEWYDPRHLPGGLIGPFAYANEFSMRWGVPQADGLIVISRYLENYYRIKGCKTHRVPPLFSEFPDRPLQLRTQNGLLNLCYAGTPGKKEEFGLLLEGIRLAHTAGLGLKLHIIGVSASELLAKYPAAEILLAVDDGLLEFHGRLSNQATRQLVAASDFLLIARRPLRFANAGFPFKIAESMMLGTPVISNCFSDINEYIVDGVNGILIKKLAAKDVYGCIFKAVSFDEAAMLRMQNEVRLTAQKIFSSYEVRNTLSDFLMDKNELYS
jgi:glycosyltransferase involved in cell wall biosynthesis